MFQTRKDALSTLANINKNQIKKLRTFGMENEGIFTYQDRVFKFSASKREFLIAKRLIGKNFKNVVKIHNTYECDVLGICSRNVWKSYIIEEEKLKRIGKSFAFDDFDLQRVCVDVERRAPYFAAILNGIVELSSIGIRYNDLHPLNVMYDNNQVAKIIDFGLASTKRKFQQINMSISFDFKQDNSTK